MQTSSEDLTHPSSFAAFSVEAQANTISFVSNPLSDQTKKQKKKKEKDQQEPVSILKRTDTEITQPPINNKLSQQDRDVFNSIVNNKTTSTKKEKTTKHTTTQKNIISSPEDEENEKAEIRLKIDRYYSVFFDRLRFEKPKLSVKSSIEDHRLSLSTVEKDLNSANGLTALKMMVRGMFGFLEATTASIPELGLNLSGLDNAFATNEKSLEPTLEEMSIKHASWFAVSVERRLVYELMQIIAMTHKMNTDSEFAAKMHATVSNTQKEDYREL